MFLPYYIKSEDVDNLTLNAVITYDFNDRYNELTETVAKTVTADMIERNLINGTKLQEAWFPSEEHFDIFLSHSHPDEPQAKRFAAYLQQEHKVKVFIDSCYWGYCNRLLQALDNKYCHFTDENGNGWYNYDKRNFTTAMIHIMLANALLEMMRKTECVIFLNTSNSINTDELLKYSKREQTTPSPWIYQEIAYANSLEKIVPERWLNSRQYPQIMREGGTLRYFSCESATDLPQTKFDVDFSMFYQLTSDFINQHTFEKGDLFLDSLHKAYINSAYKRYLLLSEQYGKRHIQFR